MVANCGDHSHGCKVVEHPHQTQHQTQLVLPVVLPWVMRPRYSRLFKQVTPRAVAARAVLPRAVVLQLLLANLTQYNSSTQFK